VEGDAPRRARQLVVSRLYLVRHAHAGDRAAWRGPDDQRPLSEKGWRQARGLVGLLSPDPVDAIVSSPAVRCVQTVEPLAGARNLAIETDDRLLEGHDAEDTYGWIEGRIRSGSIVASTHGDLVPAILALAARGGAEVPREPRWPKGSTWILERGADGWASVRFLAPPS
jgi:phosphohistidine phosphatase SixA